MQEEKTERSSDYKPQKGAEHRLEHPDNTGKGRLICLEEAIAYE